MTESSQDEQSGWVRPPRAKELRAWCDKWQAEDKWWIAAHGKVFGPYPLDEVERRCNLMREKKLMVLHISSPQDQPQYWIEMEATPPPNAPITKNIDLGSFKITSKIIPNSQGYTKDAPSRGMVKYQKPSSLG